MVSMLPSRIASVASILLFAAGCGESPAISFVGPPGTPISTTDAPVSTALSKEARRASTVAEKIDEALKAGRNGDLPEAAALLEDVLKSEPNNRRALFYLVAVDVERGSILERPKATPIVLRAAEVARRLRTSFRDLNPKEQLVLREALFQEARSFAAGGKTDKALISLAESIDAGYASVETLRNDNDLNSLRMQPKFKELLASAEKRARAMALGSAKQRLAQNKAFPFDFRLPGLDGKTVALGDFRGKVVVIDLWGTWCPPCRKEVPHLADLYKKYREKGLEVVGLNFERVPDDEKTATIQKFVKENEIPYPCLVSPETLAERVPDFQGFPTTLFVDRTGNVRAKVEGFDPNAVFELEALVTALLDEGQPSSGR
jgi:thiol-disulfide isomerase/thioredoxin